MSHYNLRPQSRRLRRVRTKSWQKPGRAARRFLPMLFLLPSVLLAACSSQPLTSTESVTPISSAAAPTASSTPASEPTIAPPKIDGERALAHVRRQVEIGPRPAGSPALNQTRDYIVKELNADGLKITTDEFRAKTPVGEKKMVNLTAEVPGESSDVVIIASHYDTKEFKEFRFVGANDGASSTAVLIELAHALAGAKQKPRLTYWLVFFDGEEAVCREWDECSTPQTPDHTYGSRRYVAQLKSTDELKRVRGVILLDMIGYKNLEMGRDEMGTVWMSDVIWRTAHELGYNKQFLERIEGVGGDDHEPFLQAGVEAVDLIQLTTYPYWHTADDTLDKISPQSLAIIGDVVLASLPRIEQRLSAKRPTQ